MKFGNRVSMGKEVIGGIEVIKFWIFMLIMNLLIPFTMIGIGWLFLHRPPKKINSFYGYRTSMSRKNQDTWEFAHRYSGKLWYVLGWILLPCSALAMAMVYGMDADTVGNFGGIVCIVQCVCLVGTIAPTEMALRKNFDKDGRRK